MQPNSNLIPPDLAVNVGGPELRMLRTAPPKPQYEFPLRAPTLTI